MDPVARILGNISHLTSGGILDIETLGLERMSPIHEVAYAIPSEGRAFQYILDPSYAGVIPKKQQDILGLAVSKDDVIKRLPLEEALGRKAFWGDVIRVHALMRQGSLKGSTGAQELRSMLGSGTYRTAQEALSSTLPGGSTVKEVLGKDDRWLLRQAEAGTYPWFDDKSVPGNMKNIPGYRDVRSERTSFEQLFRKGSPHALLGEMKQRMTWIHNAPFESAHTGAWLRLMEQEGTETGLKSTVRWRTTAGLENLYVTGPEINRARALATITGDWGPVWEAYVKHAGPGDVGDLMDVMKASQSYARNLGLTKTGRAGEFSGMSVDIATKLFLISEGQLDKVIGHKEAHVALLDAAREEGYILKRATMQAATLSEVARGTEEGKVLLRMAQGKKGPLWDAIRFFSAWDHFNSTNQEANLIQRLSRGFEDFATQGYTVQHSGHHLISSEMVSNTGERAVAPLTVPSERTRLNTPDEFIEWLGRSGQYSEVDFGKTSGNMMDYLVHQGGLRVGNDGMEIANSAALREGARAYTDQIIDRKVTEHIARIADGPGGMAGFFDALGSEVPLAARQSVAGRLFSEAAGKRAVWMTAGVMAGVGALGAVIGSFQGSRKQAPSLRAVNYEKWLQHQQEFAGLEDGRTKDGMREGGLAAERRRTLTDFGSPYRGPWASNQVFFEQEMLQERERFHRQRFGIIHNDPQFGIFAQLKQLVPSIRTSQLLHNGIERADASEYSGIQGDGLFKVNLKEGGWRMRVDDADTVTIERGLLFRDKYSFRLSGIDAPETRHGQQREQPGAYEARDKLQALLDSGTNIEMVFNPRDITYGRSLGVIMADGKNLNVELVKSGKVAALNWQSKEQQMLRSGSMSALETRAQGVDSGMWSHPFWQAYRDTLEGQQLTFNQLANMSKVASNATLMSAVSLMRQAEAQGFYSNSMMTAAAEIKQHVQMAGIKPDYNFPIVSDTRNAPHNNYMIEMQADLGNWIRTKGGKAQNKFKHRQGIDKLNSYLALDTLGTSTSVWSKRRLEAFDQYESQGNRRKSQMAEVQRNMNENMFTSPIGHHRW